MQAVALEVIRNDQGFVTGVFPVDINTIHKATEGPEHYKYVQVVDSPNGKIVLHAFSEIDLLICPVGEAP